MLSSWFIPTVSVLVLTVLDEILPLENENERRIFLMHIDCIIFDYSNYFYEVLIYFTAVYFYLACVHTYSGTVFISGVEYTCALLEITW